MKKTVKRAVAKKFQLNDLRRVQAIDVSRLVGVTGGKFEGGDIEADVTQLPIAHNY